MDDFELLNLPTRTNEHVKNDLARAKFRELFRDPLFIVREETDNDYGVDICIEALANNGSSPTNIRALVQLKSSEKNRNADNTYSYSIATSNLNYLLNTPGSFYVFYTVNDDTFYYCTVDDVYSRCHLDEVKLAEQKTVTVNFKDILNEEAVQKIHSELIHSAILFKNVRLKVKEKGIQPRVKFAFGELYYQASKELLEKYLEENNLNCVYTTDENGKVLFLHNLIWEGQHGKIPKGYQVYHLNGNTLDNRRCNLEIVKTTKLFSIEAFQAEIEDRQACNILTLIIEGEGAELDDVPTPPVKMFNSIIEELKLQGWTASEKEVENIKELLGRRLGMRF